MYTICAYLCLDARLRAHTSLLGDFFIPTFPCPGRVERIGVMGDGGKWVCGLERMAKQDKCVIYSFGPSPSPILTFPELTPDLA